MPEIGQFHSEDAQDIMGRAPSWVVRWGVTLIFCIFAGILLGCYFIKYPETVAAPIVITTVNPPAELTARTEGLLEMIDAKDGDRVNEGEMIAVIAGSASYRDVDSLYKMLVKGENLPADELLKETWTMGDYRLGELQSAFSEFKSAISNYRSYIDIGYIDAKSRLLEAQIAKNREYFSKLKAQKRLLGEDMKYLNKSVARDSALYGKGVISSAEFETSQRSRIDKQNTIEGFDASLVNTELGIIQTEQQLIELSIQKQNEVAEHERNISRSLRQLMAQIEQWRMAYVITAPAEGTVTFTRYWSVNQHVKAGEVVATVVPDGETAVTGRMYIPSTGFGKVATGQTVNVKLNGYPYMEYGILKGEILSVSAVPDAEKGYVADVRFPKNLVTSYGKELSMIQQMDGQAEIITGDKRLIARFFDPIKALFKAR